jgi:hypothetical protein
LALSYDALNRPTNMVDGIGTTVYTYTSGGFLYTEDGPFANDTGKGSVLTCDSFAVFPKRAGTKFLRPHCKVAAFRPCSKLTVTLWD